MPCGVYYDSMSASRSLIGHCCVMLSCAGVYKITSERVMCVVVVVAARPLRARSHNTHSHARALNTCTHAPTRRRAHHHHAQHTCSSPRCTARRGPLISAPHRGDARTARPLRRNQNTQQNTSTSTTPEHKHAKRKTQTRKIEKNRYVNWDMVYPLEDPSGASRLLAPRGDGYVTWWSRHTQLVAHPHAQARAPSSAARSAAAAATSAAARRRSARRPSRPPPPPRR